MPDQRVGNPLQDTGLKILIKRRGGNAALNAGMQTKGKGERRGDTKYRKRERRRIGKDDILPLVKLYNKVIRHVDGEVFLNGVRQK